MDLVVFGASGRTGRAVVEQALRAGHQVTGVVRRAGALGSVPGLRLIVMADFTRQEGVDDAVRGQDVVISSLGSSSGPTSVCTDDIRAILAAMSRTGTRRLIVVSAYGAAETHDRSLYSRVLWARLSAKMRDKEAMERLIRASDTDWSRAPTRPEGQAAHRELPHRNRCGDPIDLVDPPCRPGQLHASRSHEPQLRRRVPPDRGVNDTMAALDMTGRVSLVTGATGGMGRRSPPNWPASAPP